MKPAKRADGQSMVEFALIVPLLLMLIFGVIELGIMFSVYVGLTNSAREAAREGAIYLYTGTSLTWNTGNINSNNAIVDTERLKALSQVITSTMNPLVDPVAALTRTVTYTPSTSLAEYRAGDTINVQLEHDHPLFFGLFGTNRKITIKATSAMKIEPGAGK
jgi:Flp pilus assembly protein TadG